MLRPFAASMFASTRNADRLVAMKQSLDDLQRQLGTGRRAETLGGLGPARGLSLGARAQLAETSAYRTVIQRAETRTGLMTASLDRIGRIGSEARTESVGLLASGSAVPTAAAQGAARARLDAVIEALNEDFDGQFLFSGANAAMSPVASSAEILGGRGAEAGLNQLIDERRQADAGDGLGRLTLARSGATTTASEQAAGLPFGLKIAGVSNGLGNASASVGGTPAALAVTFTGLPAPGDKIDVLFDLPDGTQERLTLQARQGGGSSAAGFQIGADAAQTSANFAAALDSGLRGLVADRLAAASSMVACDGFFAGTASQPAPRIDGPPFANATAFAAPGSRPTLLWYKGEDGPADPRETQKIRADRGIDLAVGARANEAPFRSIMAGLAALAAGPALSDGTYRAIAGRAGDRVTAMSGADGRGIVADIGAAQQQMKSAGERHNQTDAIYKAALGDAESVPIEELSVQIVALQTRLQASYQVTASISRLNLADFLR